MYVLIRKRVLSNYFSALKRLAIQIYKIFNYLVVQNTISWAKRAMEELP